MTKLLTALFSSLLITLAYGEPVPLETPQGKIIGETSLRDNSVSVFRGIPFAAAPVGKQRWKTAGPAPSWSGELMTDSFAPDCIQAPYAEGTFFYRPSRITSEDCLYLNVWTAADAGEKKAVMVWIHGGGLTRGSGAGTTYEGTNLALKDVVVVTINYRLGVFGYLAHPELSAESVNGVSGNYGVMDQVQALKWVRDNIAAFGGDPDNVTIFGESAGSWSVNLLTASPLAKGLFHKAIGESGARLDTRVELKRETTAGISAEAAGIEFAKAAGADSLQDLRNMTGPELLSAALANGFRTDGIVDGWAIPQQPFEIFTAGKQNKVPVLLGFNRDEGTTLGAARRIPATNDAYISRIQSTYGDLANEYMSVYPSSNLRASTMDSYRDGSFGWNMVTWADLTATVNEEAYLYFFTHNPPGPNSEELGAYHAAEISYVFGNVEYMKYETREVDRQVAESMSNYFVAFAKNGTPNIDGQPSWQRYTDQKRNYVIFDAVVQPSENLLPTHWDLFDKIMASRRP